MNKWIELLKWIRRIFKNVSSVYIIPSFFEEACLTCWSESLLTDPFSKDWMYTCQLHWAESILFTIKFTIHEAHCFSLSMTHLPKSKFPWIRKWQDFLHLWNSTKLHFSFMVVWSKDEYCEECYHCAVSVCNGIVVLQPSRFVVF